jgi:cytochrome c oxidase subunit II
MTWHIGLGPIVVMAVAGASTCAEAAPQSALDYAAQQARLIGGLWWLMFWVCAAVYVVVLVGLGAALWRRRIALHAAEAIEPQRERRIGFVVAGCVGATVAILFVFLVASYSVGSRLFTAPESASVAIEVTGHQWWWAVRYQHETPSKTFITANEIHIPVGQPVKLTLRSQDVIHSFWVPNLAGKRDLIPGQTNDIWITAERPGTYRGQCAEFCGLQHAHMALYVTAEDPGAFDRWQEQQRRPAPAPATPEAQRGQQVFLSGPCAMCHAILGTTAQATAGPDLTHIASRPSIGAGRLPNTRGHLAGWIADPQTQKPGNNMPLVPLPPEDFQALLAYLDTLK